MLRKILKTGALAGWFSFAISGAGAQEIIHAYAGTVSAVDAVSRTITVALADSSTTPRTLNPPHYSTRKCGTAWSR